MFPFKIKFKIQCAKIFNIINHNVFILIEFKLKDDSFFKTFLQVIVLCNKTHGSFLFKNSRVDVFLEAGERSRQMRHRKWAVPCST